MRAAAHRRAAVVLCGMSCAAAATGCRDRRSARQPPARVSVVDDVGRTVQLAAPAQRIASLSPANTEVLFALGCGQRVVLRDRASRFPPAAGALPATDAFSLSADHIVGFRPDLVLLSHADGARLAALTSIGLTVASFDPTTLDQVLGTMRAIGALCGADARAAALTARLRRRIAAARHAVPRGPRPRVYAELDGADPARPWTAGRGSFVDELISLAGGTNAIDGLPRPYAQISAETILRSDPQVILLAVTSTPSPRFADRLRERPGWRQLTAVREGRVIDTIDGDLLSRPGPRLVDGLEQLVAALHPHSPAAPPVGEARR